MGGRFNQERLQRSEVGNDYQDEPDSDQDIFEEMFKEIFLKEKLKERRCMGTCSESTCSDPKESAFLRTSSMKPLAARSGYLPLNHLCYEIYIIYFNSVFLDQLHDFSLLFEN